LELDWHAHPCRAVVLEEDCGIIRIVSARELNQYEQTAYADRFERAAAMLDWLKSKGEGYLTRINEILRERIAADLERKQA
jgi:hypothetical protein